MINHLMKTMLVCIWITFTSSTYSQESNNKAAIDNSIIETVLVKKSDEYFKQLKAQYSEVNNVPHSNLVRKIANRLSLAAGQGKFTQTILIGRNKMYPKEVNAFVLPGGQMIFTEELMNQCSSLAEKLYKKDRFGDSTESNFEGLLAGVMGHELGHYFGKHQLRSVLKKMSNSGLKEKRETVEKIVWRDIKNEQGYETESDMFSFHILGKSGYNPKYMLHVLKMFKALSEADNPYLSSHPSNNERLSKLEKNDNDKAYYKRMSQLEYAFGSIETGAFLEEAAITLKQEISQTKDNPYLLSALAKVYHRLWEKSCTISDLRFKTSIISVPFRESMLHASEKKGSVPLERRYWCDKGYYLEALNYYLLATVNFAGPYTLTSYAALLAYHPTDYESAMLFGSFAVNQIDDSDVLNKIKAINNLGIVYYFNEKNEDAMKMFFLAANVSETIKEKIGSNASYKATDGILKKYSGKNIGKLDEAFFNIASFFQELGNRETDTKIRNNFYEMSKQFFTKYASEMDIDTEWGKYAWTICCSKEKKVPEKPERLFVSFKDEEKVAGSSAKTVDVKIEAGKPYKEINRSTSGNIAEGPARGFSRGVTIYLDKNETVKGFSLDQSVGINKPKLSNDLEVGMSKTVVEQKIGKPPIFFGTDETYYPKQGLRILYKDNTVNRIDVFFKDKRE
jgi:tetratricopeptide (TPR) repeat protein